MLAPILISCIIQVCCTYSQNIILVLERQHIHFDKIMQAEDTSQIRSVRVSYSYRFLWKSEVDFLISPCFLFPLTDFFPHTQQAEFVYSTSNLSMYLDR